ncbi:hypothetical protein H6P81_003136 [Aristolochia fimbriata]|uniref:Uncharacterized protein n=1 Tax=Aristolochia fimbriata TaxID=158543 RepID=A0AAV7FG73_ARIFI|nr:hypothetical protein H6P81_003136 [Aristolochia fimbriata]
MAGRLRYSGCEPEQRRGGEAGAALVTGLQPMAVTVSRAGCGHPRSPMGLITGKVIHNGLNWQLDLWRGAKRERFKKNVTSKGEAVRGRPVREGPKRDQIEREI